MLFCRRMRGCICSWRLSRPRVKPTRRTCLMKTRGCWVSWVSQGGLSKVSVSTVTYLWMHYSGLSTRVWSSHSPDPYATQTFTGLMNERMMNYLCLRCVFYNRTIYKTHCKPNYTQEKSKRNCFSFAPIFHKLTSKTFYAQKRFFSFRFWAQIG